MQPCHRTLLCVFVTGAFFCASPVAALDQTQRVELADLLTLDDRAEHAAADEAFAAIKVDMFEVRGELDVLEADYELVAGPYEQAALELAAAEQDLKEARADDAPSEEIADLEDVVFGAKQWVEEVSAEVEPLARARDEAKARFDGLTKEVHAAQRELGFATRELHGTQRFVQRLDDPRADALYTAMLGAAEEGWLPLDIDLDALEWIVQKQISRRAVSKLPEVYQSAREQGGEGFVAFVCAVGDPECPDDAARAEPALADDTEANDAEVDDAVPEPAGVRLR